ncbi:uncharacterized protein LOC113294557 [Papaver somniferum]|uniref:uncharacterized protein LOC113294557 n=1 Tax=Papaver somniferum TaxID=3469 RepID=UPI000E701C64|nr:uncharacterized protein LOC113294557 [Papaver somniferum]
MEFLSRSLLIAESNKSITGIRVSRKAPAISHLLFADDILIFGQADMQHVNDILRILQNFGTLCGQMLNFDKSCVYFSHNLEPDYCDYLATTLNMSIVTDSEKYLGAPLLLGHSKVKSFDPIMHSFEARLKSYVSITLNQAGRSTLIKSVLNSLPTYQMSCFKIPTTLLNKLDSLQLNFWCGHKSGKGIKFVGWDSINKSKEMGGLGFRDLETFNTALICKLVWKIVIEDKELWVQILSAKYFKNCSILHRISLMRIVPGFGGVFIENTRSWNAQLVHYLFNEDCAKKVLAMNVHVIGKDSLIWLSDRKG